MGQEELTCVVKLHEKSISFSEFIDITQRLKREYPQQTFDVSSWSLARCAGWIDSDGYMCLANSRDKYFYPMVSISQKNKSLISSFKKRFGGSSFQGKDGVWRWKVQGMSVLPLLELLQPHFKHKKAQCDFILQKDGVYDLNDCKIVSALNTRN